MDFKGKKVLIIGMAKTGLSVASFLHDHGAEVLVNDIKSRDEVSEEVKILESKGIKTFTGSHPEKLLDDVNLVIPSPGVSLNIPILREAKRRGLHIISELELGFLFSRARIIAVTGTNGKTTTTTLINEILKNDGKETVVAGNIGIPLVRVAESVSINGYIVTEVSSFQLEAIEKFKPQISVILNITPDHLNRHLTFENYVLAKSRIFENQDENDFVVLNADDDLVRGLSQKTRSKVVFFSRKKELDDGVFVKNDVIVIKDKNRLCPVCHSKELGIKGCHNLENALAATAVAWLCNVNLNSLAETLKDFQGVEHRLEYVETIAGVKFINDSKATNPDAAIKALEAVEEPIVLIAGGMEKGVDFTGFAQSFKNRVKALVVLGETASKIAEAARENGVTCIKEVSTMEDAVNEAFKMAVPGDCVLLSPACASWDMFKNFEERGRIFKKSVREIGRK
ncbi:MAG: UDP-N-acetylmuramoylalanine--D-glutamate ligase [Thermosediminibacterales bacterium]|nr:UDP-N-acetylmuramoylalanine--D-glutamate ligase [Thermosediminibacterales bacterium]